MAEEVKQVQRVGSQTGDIIQDIEFTSANTYERKLSKAPLKAVQISMFGHVTPTWSSTAPVARGFGAMADLIDEIEIEDSMGTVRSIKSGDVRRLMKTFIGSDSPAVYKKNSTTLNGASVGFMEFGSLTSGQSVAFMESIEIPFECFLTPANFLDTLLQYDGRKENLIRVKTKSFSNLNKPSVNSDATWAATIFIRVRPIISGSAGPGKRWKQFSKEENFTSATDRRVIKLDEVQNLMGLGLYVYQGDDKTPVDLEEANKIHFKLTANKGGSVTTLKPKTSLRDLMFENLNKRFQSSIVDGFAYMPLIQGGLLESALANGYDDLNLEVAMESGLSNYSSPGYTVRVVVDEVTGR